MLNVQLVTTRKQTARQLAKYRKHLAGGPKPKGKFSNPRNLFDDSNVTDREIFMRTVDFINRR